MVNLTRIVRFCVNPGDPPDAALRPDGHRNGYAAVPRPRGLPRYYELAIVCRGEPDATTGYLIDIKAIDRAARASVLPAIARACAHAPETDPATMMPGLAQALSEALPVTLASLAWSITPTFALEVHMDAPRTVLMRQRFDFAAAHRLHVPALSDDENRAAFGKCNNPSGHGHNYQVEPVVALDLDRLDASPFTLADLERLADERVVEPFDHTHLNIDTPDFRTGEGVNPSVEHIARVCFERLAPAVRAASPAATLRSVTVWETDRTSCTFPG